MASVPKLLLLLLFCSSYHSLVAHAGDDHSYKVLSLDSLKSDAVCSERKAPSSSGAATLPLHHRHSPCSPLATKKTPTLEEILRRDQLRASYIQRKFSAKGGAGDVQQSDATVPTTLGDSLNTLEYVIRRPRLAGQDPDHAHRHRQRRVMGAVQAVLAVPLPGGPALRPQLVAHLLPVLLQLRHLHAARPGRERVFQLLPVPVNCHVRRRLQYDRDVQLRHARAGFQHRQQLPVRVQSGGVGLQRPNRRAHGPRRRPAVTGVADRGQVRQGLLLLPPGDVELLRVPHARRGNLGIRQDADAQEQPDPHVLQRPHPGHQGGREAAQHRRLGLLVRDGHGLRHGHHAAAANGILGALVGVQGRDEAVPAGAAQWHLRHVLRLQRTEQCHDSDRRAGVLRRRGR